MDIRQLFGWLNYTKYSEMNQVTKRLFKNSPLGNSQTVNCYIDLGSMVQVLYNNPTLKVNDPRELCSLVLNLGAHIRGYFRSYHEVYAILYFVYSDNEWDVLKKIYPEYLSKSNPKKNYKEYRYIRDCMNMVKMISKYLPNTYYIESDAETDGVILATIRKEQSLDNNYPNIIFTRNVALAQLPTLDDRTFIYYKKIYKGYSILYGTDRENAIINFLKFTGRYNPLYDHEGYIIIHVDHDIKDAKFYTKTNRSSTISKRLKLMNPSYLGAFMAFSGLSSRDITSRLNWQATLEALYKIEEYIPNPELIYDLCNLSTVAMKRISKEEFVQRYKVVSSEFHASLYKQSMDYSIDYHINLQSVDELKYVNDHYFSDGDFIDLNRY